MHYDVISIGEILVDFISQNPGKQLPDVTQFEKFAGGAPANVAVGLARLDRKVDFTGRVGADSFGRFLRQFLETNSIGTDLLITDPDRETRLAFVSIDENGERSFEFYGKNPADLALRSDDISKKLINSSSIVHFGSLGLTDEFCRREFIQISDVIHSTDTLISFDPNYRPSLWRSEAEAFRVLNAFAVNAHILKINLEEKRFLCDGNNIDNILKTYNTTRLLALTLGKDGCLLSNGKHSVEIPGFPATAVDTTGCGDAFMAALLDGILQMKKLPEDLSIDELTILGRKANAAGAITVTRYGATDGLPTRNKIEHLLNTSDY